MQQCTSSILSICDDLFNPNYCNQLARKTKFVQRSTSKIKGHEFIKVLVLPSEGLQEDSLNGLCERMKEFNPKADISASALTQRIKTKAAVRFMMASFEKILTLTREKFVKQDSSLGSILKFFKNIYIQDSTVFEVNKKLAKSFPGTKRGGKKGKLSCKSQVKIDLIHNVATGLITEAKIYEGKCPDQAMSEKIESIIMKGDLSIRDLGYFKIASMRRTDNKGAYFLTRFPSHVKVYLNQDDDEAIDLATYLNEQYKHQAIIELTVWISDERLKVRLVAYRVPKEVVAQRRRKAHKGAKEMGRILSKEKLALLNFSIFVTNIPARL